MNRSGVADVVEDIVKCPEFYENYMKDPRRTVESVYGAALKEDNLACTEEGFNSDVQEILDGVEETYSDILAKMGRYHRTGYLSELVHSGGDTILVVTDLNGNVFNFSAYKLRDVKILSKEAVTDRSFGDSRAFFEIRKHVVDNANVSEYSLQGVGELATKVRYLMFNESPTDYLEDATEFKMGHRAKLLRYYYHKYLPDNYKTGDERGDVLRYCVDNPENI